MRTFFTLFILVFFFPLEAWSISFIKLRSGIEGSSKVEFQLDEKSGIMDKNSNFFDSKKSYILGRFYIPVQKTEGPIKSLNSLDLKVSQIKELPPIKPHEAYFVLNGKKVGRDSPLFKTLGKVFAEIQALPWVQQEGIIYSSDLKTKTIIKNEKIISKNIFDSKFYCNNSVRPSYCLDKDYGIIYVE
jgi:hypothetical protein